MNLTHSIFRWAYYTLVALALAFCAITAVFFWRVNELTFALFSLTFFSVTAVVYLHPKLYNYRFIAPALLVLLVVIVAPIFYIVNMSFSNLSENNKLNYHRALPYITEQTYIADDGLVMNIYGWQSDDQRHLYLQDTDSEQWYQTEPLANAITLPLEVVLVETDTAPEDKFDRKFAISQRSFLDGLTLVVDNGRRLSKSKLRSFAERKPRFTEVDSHVFLDHQTGDTVTANFKTGQFEITQSDDEDRLGSFISPTFLKSANLENYTELLLDADEMKVFSWVFLWSVFSATVTVALSFFVALMTASLLNWPALREREFYKFLIVGCYALPAFAVINAFFWVFSTNAAPWGDALPGGPVFKLGEWLFGLGLDWQFNPILARVKFLIVQFWMFMPLMFIVCLGVIQSIPKSVYEAASLEGAGTRQKFLRITLPMSFLPLAPVLLIAFATAFNDLALVDQLTFGFPEIPHSVPRASHVDLLVSFANRQAFGVPWSRGVGFGFYSLAATLFTLIFIILALISYVYLRLVNKNNDAREY